MERPATSGPPPRAARSSASSSSTTSSSSSSRATRAAGGKTSPPAIPEFTDEEYVLYLENPSWTKEDTLSLLDAVRIFDLEWNLVASTFHGDSRKTPSVPSPTPFHTSPLFFFFFFYLMEPLPRRPSSPSSSFISYRGRPTRRHR
jgi:hypothetical protein